MANLAAALTSKTSLLEPASHLNLLHEESKFASLHLTAVKRLWPKGLRRGIIAEINGRRSSGRTSLCFHVLVQATTCGEICAVVDGHDSFHPASAAAAGVHLERLIWVRCQGNTEAAIRAVDLLLHAGGFGVVLLDLCEANRRVLNRLPLSYWYRFRRAVEHTPTILLVCAEAPQARSCASSNMEVKPKALQWTGKAPFLRLQGLQVTATHRERSVLQSEPLCIRSMA